MPTPEYSSLSDTLERFHNNQLALEAAAMELTLLLESKGHAETGYRPLASTRVTTASSLPSWCFSASATLEHPNSIINRTPHDRN